jgi:hypothetical protein
MPMLTIHVIPPNVYNTCCLVFFVCVQGCAALVIHLFKRPSHNLLACLDCSRATVMLAYISWPRVNFSLVGALDEVLMSIHPSQAKATPRAKQSGPETRTGTA